MADYPDNTRLFQLVGTEITIPINIESSDVVLGVSIDAVAADLDVTIIASDVTIDFNFADQAVAVFDAAKWFAHEADQVYIYGTTSLSANGSGTLVDRTVPTGKVFYVCGMAWGTTAFTAMTGSHGQLRIDGTVACHTAGITGGHIIFDVPLRATAGQVVLLNVSNVCAATSGLGGGFWGWDEDEE